MRKGVNGEIFSAEPGNLFNKHSYKYSGMNYKVTTMYSKHTYICILNLLN